MYLFFIISEVMSPICRTVLSNLLTEWIKKMLGIVEIEIHCFIFYFTEN